MQTSTRGPSRSDSRVPSRFIPAEPHQKFDIPKERVPEGMVAEWKAMTLFGMTNRNHMIAQFQAGWTPARAADFPEISGYGVELGASILKLNLMQNVQPDDAIIKDGQILMLRPKELVQEATRRHKRESRDMIDTQLKRLSANSREQAPGKTSVKRGYIAPDNDE